MVSEIESANSRGDTLLLITTSFPITRDGSEAAGAFVADIASELAERLPLRVVAPGLREETERIGAIDVWRFASTGKPLSLLSPAKPWHWPDIVASLLSLRRQTLRAGADGRIGHSLALWVIPSGWAAAALKRRSGTPYSIWALGSDIWSLGRIPFISHALARVCRGAEHAYADGFQLSDDAEKIAGRVFRFLPSTRKLVVVRERPVASRPPLRLLFLGRWHRNKGLDILLDALALLDDESWSAIEEIHIAGGGPLRDLVATRVNDLVQCRRPVRISGFLGHDEALSALSRADRLLLPSRIESIPVIFSDAMKAGLPVISTPVGDLPRLVVDGVGAIADDVSATAFAMAIKRSLATPLTVADRAKIREAAMQFEISMIADRLVSDIGARIP